MAQLWDDGPLAVIDIETTSCNPNWAHVCEIGGVSIYQGKIYANPQKPRGAYDSLVKPPPKRYIGKDARAIHGITYEMVKGFPTLPDQMPNLGEFLRDKVWVMHSASGDLRCLAKALKGYRFPLVLDSLRLARHLHKGKEIGNSLQALIEHYNLLPEIRPYLRGREWQPHRAFCDALATALLFRKMVSLAVPGATLDQLVATCRHG